MHLLTRESTPSVLSELSVFRNQDDLRPHTTALSRAEGRPVVRPPTELHLHPALENLGWAGLIQEFNNAANSAVPSMHDPILIARDGTVLAGFGRWRLAVFEQTPEIYCIEHALNTDESLAFILTHHQTQRGWNAFVRIRLALTLKPSLQTVALNNMRSGGKHKGLANLPEAHHVDVRQQVADMAGACPRNVGNVETILENGHPRLIDALVSGTLKINRAIQFCKLPRTEQLEEFIRYSEERATSKVIRRCLVPTRKDDIRLDVETVLEALCRRKEIHRGSVLIRIVRQKRTVILIGQDLLAEIKSQKELQLK
jgi:hypothetical protein